MSDVVLHPAPVIAAPVFAVPAIEVTALRRHRLDGEIVAGAVLTVESFVGSEHGGPGVKPEDMYVVTDTGAERLSPFPFGEALLA